MTREEIALNIACDLLIGSVLYGYDYDRIFGELMERDGCVSSNNIREFILDHIEELGKEYFVGCNKEENEMNRLEMEIENYKMRAIMHEITGEHTSSKDEWYLYDCLTALKNIQDCGDCNVCVSKKDCEYAPAPGQMVRYNCPFYKKEGDEQK